MLAGNYQLVWKTTAISLTAVVCCCLLATFQIYGGSTNELVSKANFARERSAGKSFGLIIYKTESSFKFLAEFDLMPLKLLHAQV